MPVDVLSEIVIDRPCAVVSAYTADPTHVPEWYTNIDSVRWHSPAPVSAGSTVDFVGRFLGRPLTYRYVVVEFSPAHRLVMSTVSGPFPMRTAYTWQPIGAQSTRMTLRSWGRPAGFAALATPLLASAVRRANVKDLRLLKQLLEGAER